nr:hypothetical protein [Anaerolineae bacterium]
MRINVSRGDFLGFAGLLLAWIGAWGAWITHKAAGLTLNAYDLAERAEYLQEVRFGDMSAAPDTLRFSIVMALIAFAIAAGFIRHWWIRLVARLTAVLPCLVLFPPYPQILSPWRSGQYRTQFIIAAMLVVGVALSYLIDRFPVQRRRILSIIFCIPGIVPGIWGYLSLTRLLGELYDLGVFPPGWGLLAYTAGLSGAALVLLITITRHERTQRGLMGI